MSYILAALKKSEQEREQLEATASTEQAAMTIDSVVDPRSMSTASSVNLTSRSLVISYALAVIVLSSLFAYLLVKPSSQSHDLFVAVEKPVASELESKVQEVDEMGGVAEADITDVKALEINALEVKEVKVTKAEIEMNPKLEAEVEAEVEIIGIEQASDSLLDQMPSLEITSHIYSSQAKRRSIVVNGERLAEGDFVAGQIQVKEITHQGMVLKVKGSLLAVNRSRGWNR